MVLGPPCSNWIGLSRSHHGRTRLFPRGYTTLPAVRIANAIAEVVAEVLQFCDARGLAYFIEQPSTSTLFHYPAVAAAIAAGLATRVTWHMGAFGFRTPKASTGYCSAWWALLFVERARRLLRRQSCGGGKAKGCIRNASQRQEELITQETRPCCWQPATRPTSARHSLLCTSDNERN